MLEKRWPGGRWSCADPGASFASSRWRQDWWTAHGLCESQECDLGREGLSGALNLVVAV